MRIKDPATDAQTEKIESRRRLVGLQGRESGEMRAQWRKMKLPTMAEKNAEKVEDHCLGY